MAGKPFRLFASNIARAAAAANESNRQRSEQYIPETVWEHPLVFGLQELDWFFESCDRLSSFNNVSEDFGQAEELNRPDLYGFYKQAEPGRRGRYTYDEVARCITSMIRDDTGWVDSKKDSPVTKLIGNQTKRRMRTLRDAHKQYLEHLRDDVPEYLGWIEKYV